MKHTGRIPLLCSVLTQGVRAMADYYVYLLNGEGHIVRRREVCSDSDADAIKAACDLLKSDPVVCPVAEVWQGTRVVRKLRRDAWNDPNT